MSGIRRDHRSKIGLKKKRRSENSVDTFAQVFDLSEKFQLYFRTFAQTFVYSSFMHLKRFLEWIGLKEKLDAKQSKVPHVSQGQIWWASLGENVGFEINGKSKDFTRPVIIYRKLSHGFYFVIPVTSQSKSGTWYVTFKQRGRSMAACLHQARALDYRRLHTVLGRVDDSDFCLIKEGFLSLYS